MNSEQYNKLRKPFPREVIGKLPKGGVQLDYVGHAAVTDRLLEVDPEWTWEPLGFTPEGLPALDGDGNLWIRLTVCGITRLGVGDGRSMKERIGDALRNAAMRFGVALDLWTRDELESHLGHTDAKPTQRTHSAAALASLVEVKKQLLGLAATIQPELEGKALTDYVLAAIEAHGFNAQSVDDLSKLADEWKQAA